MDDMIKKVARAIYAEAPNGGVVWQPNTAGGHSQKFMPDSWEEAPDRHDDCRRQARAAIEAIRPALLDAAFDEERTYGSSAGDIADLLGYVRGRQEASAAIDHALQTQGEGE